jgi:hypothetical protein
MCKIRYEALRRRKSDMLATTILVDEIPVCVVRPTDKKDLDRFIRNGKGYLLADNQNGKITYRDASDCEASKWRQAFTLHRTWSGADEGFFGVPL